MARILDALRGRIAADAPHASKERRPNVECTETGKALAVSKKLIHAPRHWLSFALLVAACGTEGDLVLGTVPGRIEDQPAAVSPSPQDAGSSGTAEDASVAEVASDAAARPADDESAPAPSAPEEAGSNPIVLCGTEPVPAPARRYDFSGLGTEVVDRMGGPSGSIVGGAALTGTGELLLDGDDDYVDLPNSILRGQPELTLLLWVSLRDGPAYWRLLDFGTGSDGEDPTGSAVGTEYLAITTETGFDPSGLALFIGQGGASSEDRILTEQNLDDENAALGVVYSDVDERARFYYAGAVLGEVALRSPIADFDDDNNWLGRSQYSADPHYPGVYRELRIYEHALSDCEVLALTRLGPDRLP